MAVLTSAPNLSFAMSPVAAAAAGSRARADEPALVHGAEPKPSTLSLEEVKRIILEATEKLWRLSGAATQSLWQMLLNFFRWITRPWRDAMAPKNAAPGGVPLPGARVDATLERNNVLSPPSLAQRETPQNLGAPDDDFDMVDSVDKEPGPSPVKVSKLAFPKSFAAPRKDDGGLAVDAATVQGALARLAEKHPDVDEVEPQALPVAAAVCLLEEYVAKVALFQSQARSLDEQIRAKLALVASEHDAPADEVLQQVLAGGEVGGEHASEIRRLAAERADHESKATEFQGHIETALLNLKQQGLDVGEIAERARVSEALPDWTARLERVSVQEPPAPTPAERQELALQVEAEAEAEPEHTTGPSPERVARLRASMISNISNDEHEPERPRG
jgi:hypothetical protein